MPLERIIKEKTSADHLLYVSLKYTKTCDVILNLIERWKIMIELSIDSMLQKMKKKRIIASIPVAPKMKVDVLRNALKKEPSIVQTLEIYEFFRKIPSLNKSKENEFRKNVCLKITLEGKEIKIDMDKLKEYSEMLERFIKFTKEYLS